MPLDDIDPLIVVATLINLGLLIAAAAALRLSVQQAKAAKSAEAGAHAAAKRATAAAEDSASSHAEAASAARRSAEAAERANRIEEARDAAVLADRRRAFVRATLACSSDRDMLTVINDGEAAAIDLEISVSTQPGDSGFNWLDNMPPKGPVRLDAGATLRYGIWQLVPEGGMKRPLVVELHWTDPSGEQKSWRSNLS